MRGMDVFIGGSGIDGMRPASEGRNAARGETEAAADDGYVRCSLACRGVSDDGNDNFVAGPSGSQSYGTMDDAA